MNVSLSGLPFGAGTAVYQSAFTIFLWTDPQIKNPKWNQYLPLPFTISSAIILLVSYKRKFLGPWSTSSWSPNPAGFVTHHSISYSPSQDKWIKNKIKSQLHTRHNMIFSNNNDECLLLESNFLLCSCSLFCNEPIFPGTKTISCLRILLRLCPLSETTVSSLIHSFPWQMFTE